MANLAGDITQKIFGHSEADKAFRPWWDNFEDGVLYGLVVMGKVAFTLLISDLHNIVIIK